jgi:type IV pilus assembly protein PilE
MNLVSAQRERGFTLIELMVVVVIATILLAIAVPNYMSQMRQSRRTEAKTALLDLAGREERFFSTAAAVAGPNYSLTPSDIGYTGAWPILIGSNYYRVSVCVPAAAACQGVNLTMPTVAAAPSYVIVAQPAPGTSQVNDTQCGSFGVDSVGQQYATGTGGAAYCWSN